MASSKYADDIEALRLYGDPTISVEEKIRRLSEPDQRIALADNAGAGGGSSASDVPRENPGFGGGGAPSGSVTAPTSVQQPAEAPGGLPPTAGDIQADPTLSPVEKSQIAERNAAAVPPLAAPTGETKLTGAAEGETPRGPGDYRSALRMFQGGGAGGRAPVPTETIRQEEQIARGSLDQGQNAEITQAQEAADNAGLQAATAQVGLDQSAAQIQIAAQEQAQREREALTAIRAEAVKKMQGLRDKQDRITEELAKTEMANSDIWAGQSFGEQFQTALSGVLYALGGNDPIKLVNALTEREVNRQAQQIKAKMGAANAYGTIMERAMANYGDIELAKKQTVVDILGKAELETQKMMVPGLSEIQMRKLQAQAEQLHAQRMTAEADRDKSLGDKVTQSTAVQFVQARKAAQAPVPQAQSGAIPARGGAPGAVRPAQAQAPGNPDDAVRRGQELWEQGHPREALAQLPPAVRAGVEAQAKRSQKGLGAGATHEDALAFALNDALGWQVPAAFIPQSARDKLVTLPGGKWAYAASAEQAKTIQAGLTADNSLISTYGLLLNLAKKPSSKWSPAERERLKTFSTMIKPALSVSNGQGALSQDEQVMYDAPSGGDINKFEDWLLGTGAAAAEAGLQVAKARRRQKMTPLSRDPYDMVPVGAD